MTLDPNNTRSNKEVIMNIQHLKYAVEIAKYGSISKASEALYVAQPNLSRAIKDLEKELGIVIFDRSAKGIVLTPDGELLVQQAKSVLRHIDEIEDMFHENRSGKSVFCISVPRASYISHAFAEFSKKLSDRAQCEVYYKETNALRAINNIVHSDYKLGIIRYAARYDKYFKDMLEQKGLEYELVAEFCHVLITSKDSPLAEIDNPTAADLTNYIEVAHADPYVPSVSMAELRKEELPEDVSRRIFVYERASQFDVLSANPETFMLVSPVPQETLDRYGLVQLPFPGENKVYKDVLIYPHGYNFTELDRSFMTELCNSRRKFLG